MKKTVCLTILDGYGIGKNYKGNAILSSDNSYIDSLLDKYPNSQLKSSGLAVGLPEGQMGNSEVGHLTISAGRVLYQSLTRITKSISDKSFFKIEEFLTAINNVKSNNSKLHIMGLLSDGGVHSHINHIKALLKLAKDNGLTNVYLHAILDGRDVGPKTAKVYLDDITSYMKEINCGEIATLGGRYFYMDRDKNYDRTELAFDTMIGNFPVSKHDYSSILEASYSKDTFDEFVEPVLLNENGTVSNKDSIIFANFRPDRAIQISKAFTNIKFTDIKNEQLDLTYVCMMAYADEVKGEIAFKHELHKNFLGDVVSSLDKTQLRIAETEKYAHVTFFFDGGVDKELPHAKRVLIDSPKVATYDLHPEMSAYQLTDSVIEELDNNYDLVVLNFANPDMVGHTGNFGASVKAIETVNECLKRVVDKVESIGGVCVITADHGNVEELLNDKGEVVTSHSTNDVPFLITDTNIKVTDGALSDIAPTILELMNINKPKEMTGKSLIKR